MISVSSLSFFISLSFLLADSVEFFIELRINTPKNGVFQTSVTSCVVTRLHFPWMTLCNLHLQSQRVALHFASAGLAARLAAAQRLSQLTQLTLLTSNVLRVLVRLP